MSRALATIALLILSNTFMTLAWYGHIAFKSKIERFGMLSIILLSWGIARALAQDTPIILLDEPTSFLDLPNRYELCTLLRQLAHDHRKCILFSTHELDIALSLCDSIALIDPPVLRYLPTPDMACSGYIERLFSNSFVTFDTESGTIKVRK